MKYTFSLTRKFNHLKFSPIVTYCSLAAYAASRASRPFYAPRSQLATPVKATQENYQKDGDIDFSTRLEMSIPLESGNPGAHFDMPTAWINPF